MESLLQDLKHATRYLARARGFSTLAVTTLAVGIAAVTAIFSLLDAVVFRPLPFRDPDRLVAVHERRQGVPDGSLSGHEVLAWRERARAFDGLAMYSYTSANVTGRGEPRIVQVLTVSAEFFDVLGASPALGRTFAAGEDRSGANQIALLSDRFWRQQGGRADAVGSDVVLDTRPHRVVGVMPPAGDLDPDIWVPMDLPLEARRVGRHGLQVFARLRPGVTAAQAERELGDLSAQLARERSEFDASHTAQVIPLHDDVVGGARRPMLVAAGAVGFVLLIACANVAHLLLTRTAGRQHEIAIRLALGISRRRLFQSLLMESLILGAAGGLAGLLLASWAVDLLPAIIAADIPRLAEASIDRRVLAFCAALSVLTGALCGVLPAMRGARSLGARLHDGRAPATVPAHVSSALTISEVALAMTLLVGAGLLIQSFHRLSRVDPGFNVQNVLAVPLSLPASRYARPEQRRAVFEDLRTRLSGLDQVRSVGAVSNLPLLPGDNRMGITIEGSPPPGRGDEIRASLRTVAGDYFRTMEIPLTRGRTFAPSDARHAVPLIRWFEQQPFPRGFDDPQAQPVAVINETMAERFWPGQEAIGKRVRLLFSPWITVVGVVGDVRHASLAARPEAEIYLSHTQEPQSALTVLVRTSGDPLLVARTVREQVRAIDADLPVSQMRRMEDVLSTSLGRPRFDAVLFTAFSAVALLLALIGLYSVTAYGVGQRTREIGIRTALGASRRDVLRLVLARAIRSTSIGVVVGATCAFALTQLIATLLFGIAPFDLPTFAGAAAGLALMSIVASYIPARRALAIDPVRALRMN